MANAHQANGTQDSGFDVRAERLARVYAKAALDAAGGLTEQQSLVEELNALVADVLDRYPRTEQIFGSQLISEDEKLAMIDRTFQGRVSDTLLRTLKVLARHGRLVILRDVAREARELHLVRAGRVRVKVETANPVEPDIEQDLIEALRRRLSAEPVISWSVNPELIAGFVIRVGDQVVDASIRTQLEHTRQAMIDRAIEAIQRGPERFFSNSET
jgi:F-type H+-transporting ATPase subunit delta